MVHAFVYLELGSAVQEERVFQGGVVKPLPVIVWIYGGAFAFGSKNERGPLYTGQSMLQKSGYETIFITGNYRLGAFGWLAGHYMQEAGQPNAGLYDQALLFQWVQEYIGQVHGDKDQVTAWGESAGAGSILHHLIRENGTVDPTFKTFAVQSPAFEWAWNNTQGGALDKVYKDFSQFAGCGYAVDNIACLGAADVNNLTASNQELFDMVRRTGLYPVGPSVDGKWITTIPTLAFAEGSYWNESIQSTTISHTTNEAGSPSFIPPGVSNNTTFDKFLTDLMPGSNLAGVKDKIRKQYDCTAPPFNGHYIECVKIVIRDSAFTCNTRDLFDAYPKISHMMSFGFPTSETAIHSSDLVALFANSWVEVVKVLWESNITWWKDLAYATGLSINILYTYQMYFASFAAERGDPNVLPRSRLSWWYWIGQTWPVADGSADELSSVLRVHGPFALDSWIRWAFFLSSDDQNLRSICSFWTALAADVVSALHQTQART